MASQVLQAVAGPRYVEYTSYPTIIFTKLDGKLSVSCGKIVDDLIFAGKPKTFDKLINEFNEKFSLGTLVHGPGHPRFFGLKIYKEDDYRTSIDEY